MNTERLLKLRKGQKINSASLYELRHRDGDPASLHSVRFWIDDVELVWIKLGNNKDVLLVENDHWEQREYNIEAGVIIKSRKTAYCFRYYLEDIEHDLKTAS